MAAETKAAVPNRRNYRMIDLHVHPSLKTFLWNKKLHKRYRTGGAWNPFVMRVDLPKIEQGGVDAIFSSVYLPEKKMINDCFLLKFLTWLLGGKFRDLTRKDAAEMTLNIIDNFENALEKANRERDKKAEVASSFTDLNRIISEEKIAVLHSIEGAHSLSGRIENLHRFFNKGVCLLTPAHFYENQFARTVGGIPENKKFLGCFRHETEKTGGLPEMGKDLVSEMLNIGMLIDLTHCNVETRKEIYEINNNKRPLVFSHSGVFEMNSVTMNPTDEEIKIIADSGGVIGVIFMNFWLHFQDRKKGLDLIVRTIEHLRKVGGVECVAIGSDFDGFTDPPDDIKDISQMSRLTNELDRAGFSEDEIEKIWSKNILRVLQEGWGKT